MSTDLVRALDAVEGRGCRTLADSDDPRHGPDHHYHDAAACRTLDHCGGGRRERGGAGSGAGDGPAPEVQPGAGGTTVAPGLASRPSSEQTQARRWLGLVLFAAMIAGLVGWAGWAHRARRQSGGPQA